MAPPWHSMCMAHLRPFRRFFYAPLVCALALAASLCAQTPPAAAPVTITIRMYDGKSNHMIVPDNLIIRFDHQDEIHNEHLHLDEDGVSQIVVPAGAAYLSVQGTFDNSTEIYFNCDAGKEHDNRKLHWYSIATILSTGVIAPNECFNGKYERPRVDIKPGEFVFYVRQHNWRDPSSLE